MPIEYKDPSTGATIYVPTEEEKALMEENRKLRQIPTDIETVKTQVKDNEDRVNAIENDFDSKADINYVNSTVGNKADKSDLLTKADKTYVDAQISSVASGSPKGVYPTLLDLKLAYPTGNSNIYIIQSDGKWYYWNRFDWVAGGVYQSTTVADKSITPEKVNQSFYDDLSVRSTISTLESNSDNQMIVLDGSIPLDLVGANSNQTYFQSFSYGATMVSFVGKDLQVKKDDTNGYMFFKVKAVGDFAPNKQVSAILKVISGTIGTGNNNQLHIMFTKSDNTGTSTNSKVYLQPFSNGFYGAIGVTIPSDASFIEFRVDNRKATPTGDLVVNSMNLIAGAYIGKADASTKKDVLNIKKATTPNMFPDPLMKGVGWVNYLPYPQKTRYEPGTINGKSAVTIYGASDNVLAVVGNDQKIGYLSEGDTVDVILNVSSIQKTSKNHDSYLIFLNGNGTEISRTRNVISRGGLFTFSATVPVGAKTMRIRLDVNGESTNYIQIQEITMTKRETGAESTPVTTDVYTVKNMIDQSMSSSGGGGTYYVSLTGSDENAGNSPSSPYATINRALKEKPSVIVMERGDYYNQGTIEAPELTSLTIIPNNHAVFDAVSKPDGTPIRIFGSDSLTNWQPYGAIFKVAYTGNKPFEDVFVTKTLTPETSGTRPSYNATVWEITDGEADIKLKPVLSLTECLNTQSSFFYDGIDVYINPVNGVVEGKNFHAVKDMVGANLSKVNNLVMQDVVLSCFMNHPMYLRNIENLYLQNCRATHSVKNDGFSLDNTNGKLVNCNAYKNRNDGFNIHGYGDTVFIYCNGYNNYDDGISHHDGATGTIIGGNWYGNVKGGIIPTYGCDVNVYDVTCWNNRYGIAFMSSASDKRRNVTIKNANCYNNEHGIIFDYNYTGSLENCTVNNNKQGITVSNGANVTAVKLLSTDNTDCGLRVEGDNSSVTLQDSKISDNVRGVLMGSDNGSIKMSRNNILYNTTGIEHTTSSGTVTMEHRNNLYGNTTDYVGNTLATEKAKNVSIPAI